MSWVSIPRETPVFIIRWLTFLMILVSFVVSEDQYIHKDHVEELVERTTTSTWWFANIKRQGTVPFNSNSSYVVYRNVADFGATGWSETLMRMTTMT